LSVLPYFLLIAGCSQKDAPPKDPSLKVVWEQSQARREARKANGGL